eukprot:10965210-Heterocapsa_arctica.AAC.1
MESSLQNPPSSQQELPLWDGFAQQLFVDSNIHYILQQSLDNPTPDFNKFVLENESVLKMKSSAAPYKCFEETLPEAQLGSELIQRDFRYKRYT